MCIRDRSITHTLVTGFNLRQDSSYVFDSRKAGQNERKDFLRREVGRSTSAAPTYFPAAKIKNRLGAEYVFLDGGVFANNQTLYALEEARKRHPYDQKYIVLSLGTGAGLKTCLLYPSRCV